MSPVLRPSHRRRPADLGAAGASSEAAASAGAAASAKDTALVEVDSAALMGALATASRVRKNYQFSFVKCILIDYS